MPPVIIGHRGARARFPENTIEGIRAAARLGVRQFEIDVAMTRDGVVVLSHDPWLNPAITRAADGAWLRGRGPRFVALDHASLGGLDVGRIRPGSAYARGFPHQAPNDGACIPTLTDVLAISPNLSWTIEIKTSPSRPRLTHSPEVIAAAIVEVADEAGATERTTVQSFDWRAPAYLQRVRPDVSVAWLTTRSTRAWRGGQAALPGSIAARGGGTWSPRSIELTQRALDAAHRLGLRVVPWTVNDRIAAVRLAVWGVDGIITDDPVAMAAWLDRE